MADVIQFPKRRTLKIPVVAFPRFPWFWALVGLMLLAGCGQQSEEDKEFERSMEVQEGDVSGVMIPFVFF